MKGRYYSWKKLYCAWDIGKASHQFASSCVHQGIPSKKMPCYIGYNNIVPLLCVSSNELYGDHLMKMPCHIDHNGMVYLQCVFTAKIYGYY